MVRALPDLFPFASLSSSSLGRLSVYRKCKTSATQRFDGDILLSDFYLGGTPLPRLRRTEQGTDLSQKSVLVSNEGYVLLVSF